MAEHQDLTRRLNELCIRVGYLHAYVFADRYGYDRETVDNLAGDIERDLNGAITGLSIVGNIHEKRISSVDASLLESAEETVRQALRGIQSDEIYQQLLKAYGANNQSEIARLMPSVFPVRLIKKERVLYHGVVPREVSLGVAGIDFKEEKPPVDEFISPDEYIDLVLRIQTEGLLPSRGLHHSTDDNIMPVFTVSDYEDTYGLLFLELNPMKQGYGVFNSESADEDLIYTPRLRTLMKLHLKSTEFLETDRVDGWSSERPQLRLYREQLEDRLNQRKIPFSITEPHYVANLQ